MKSKSLKVLGAAAAAAVMVLSVGICANAAEPEKNTEENELPVISVMDLGINASLSSEQVHEGEDIIVTVSAEGGTGTYSYTYAYRLKGTENLISSVTSPESSYTMKIPAAGEYEILVSVADDNTSASDIINVTVQKTEPLHDNGTKLSAQSIQKGDIIKVTSDFAGGRQPYQYQYTCVNLNSNKKAADSGMVSSNVYELKVNSAAYYRMDVTVKDADGNTFTKQMDFTTYSKSSSALSLAGSNISSKAVSVNAWETFHSKVSGGTAPYKYHYSYKTEKGDWKYLDKEYVYNPDRTFKMPSEPGKYTLRIGVKDFTGKYIEKRFTVDVKEFTMADSKVSSTTVPPGTSITLESKPSYSVGAVKYHYSYHLPGKPWVYIGGYVTNSKQIFKFVTEGTYYIRTGAKDSTGKYKEKQFTVNVRNFKINNSKVNKLTAATGEKIRLTAVASYPNGAAKYHYSYHMEGKPWTYVGDYISASSKEFSFSQNGIYYLRVGAKDNNGKGVYREKQFKVTVYNKSTKTITSGTTLQKQANWRSASAMTLKSGAKVNVIKTVGKWYYVRTSNNSLGYVYNMAFGTMRNYSTINTATLPVIADDIIFSKGKNMRNLYNYVNSMGYVGANNNTLENLCVYILKYRRGACYHRAALLYYLLDRAGYEVVRVNDGIDNYTGGSPHNWCIVKTADGWRHIDPTPIIGLSKMYLVRDSYIAQYFSWNRSKYPKCN